LYRFSQASASPVLERMIDSAWRGGRCTIRVLGVPSGAVLAFLHLLYSPRADTGTGTAWEEVVAAHGPQLLALAHAYRVGWLKRAAEAAVSARLTPDRAVDMLKLAGLCDAPRLRVACARVAGGDLDAVQASDGWRFARRHDPALELELLQLLEDADRRRERWARERESREACRQLAEAMDSLDRIFAAADDDVCSTTGGAGKPCARGGDDATCQGLRLLMRHFAACARKAAPGGCARCKRLLQLFRLHAALCDRTVEQEQDQPCRVPLCR
jgi:hypothetical protein